ncbi:MAG: hypothetical protein LLG42_13180 [Chloroflexi bacterium]|nr:hypothetical protein [Chloroflexota bacterium]
MNQQSHPYRWIWFQVICVTGLILLHGCATAPASVAQGITSVFTETAATEPVLTLITETVQILETTPAISIIPNSTATPVVWIDDSTGIPQTGTLPIHPTFTVTSTPTITLTPTKGPSPHFTHIPTASPTITATSNPPGAVLSIIQPGLSSKITSPYKIQASITRGEDKLAYLSLMGEDQKAFYSAVLDYHLSEYNRLLITPTLNFSISTVAENARLILQTYDLQGRILALSSVDIILLSIGNNEIHPAQHPYAPFIIDSPDEGDEIQGDRFVVSGRVAALNNNPVIIELLDENGAILVKRELHLDPPSAGETYTPFVIALAFDVDQQTQARLSMRQESNNRIPGTIALSSVAITLLP